MKTRQQSLHDEGWQSRAGKESDAQKLDDVRVAEGAHQLTFPHELGCGSADSAARDLSRVMEEVVDLFGCADGSRYGHLLHGAIGSGADFVSDLSYVGEHERSQLRIFRKKALGGHFEIRHSIEHWGNCACANSDRIMDRRDQTTTRGGRTCASL